nr:YfbR-like 5'-deoxynucleotidase [uncultured Holophaga sp.]
MMPELALEPSQIMAMGQVYRWHTRRVARTQNILEHSAAVALLAIHLAGPEISERDRADLLHWSLVHDAHEAVYGDTPFPAKRLLEDQGIRIDQHCQEQFWGQDPTMDIPMGLLSLVDAADTLEAALWARHHAPEIAVIVAEQALEKSRELTPEQAGRLMQALGRLA